jgi:uncharacterized protein YbaA (DUF1428 family)
MKLGIILSLLMTASLVAGAADKKNDIKEAKREVASAWEEAGVNLTYFEKSDEVDEKMLLSFQRPAPKKLLEYVALTGTSDNSRSSATTITGKFVVTCDPISGCTIYLVNAKGADHNKEMNKIR